MSFIDQTAKIFADSAELKFRAVMFGRDAFYIEGARPIRIDGGEMVFRAPRALITLTGEGMTVRETCDDSTAVVGRLKGFSVEDI